MSSKGGPCLLEGVLSDRVCFYLERLVLISVAQLKESELSAVREPLSYWADVWVAVECPRRNGPEQD